MQAASGYGQSAFPASKSLVRLPPVPEASWPPPGPGERSAMLGAPPSSRSEEPPAGEGHPVAGWAPMPDSSGLSSSQTSLDASDSSDPDLGEGTLGRGRGWPGCRRPGPDAVGEPRRGPPCRPLEAPTEDALDEPRSASGVSPASQSDREAELSESWTRKADTFWNSWREGQDRPLTEEGVWDPTDDPEQVPGTDAGGESRAEGAGSWGGGLPWRWVGGLASSAGATERREGGDVTHSLHSTSPATPQHQEQQQHTPHWVGVRASGSEPESPDGGRRSVRRCLWVGPMILVVSSASPTPQEVSPLCGLSSGAQNCSCLRDRLAASALSCCLKMDVPTGSPPTVFYLLIGTAMGGGGGGPQARRWRERLAVT